ncbi:MAG: hypothetical protein Lokiarch_46620 [Candidatus Lokiarchaeum sp. GC14_75]|nr:MAG: hypothetical protein Lokiarch_46620 [Candidatus Lokiarchaeum sp. GC14_75]
MLCLSFNISMIYYFIDRNRKSWVRQSRMTNINEFYDKVLKDINKQRYDLDIIILPLRTLSQTLSTPGS